MREFLQEYGSQLVSKTIEHFQISIIALLLAIVIAVPLGILLSKTKKNSKYRINDCRGASNHSNTCDFGVNDSYFWCG